MKSQITRFVTESSAAFADLGTFLPLVLGLVVVTGMDPVGLLYGFGLFALLTAVGARGRKGGRKPALTKSQLEIAKNLVASGESISQVAMDLGVSRPTIYRAIG